MKLLFSFFLLLSLSTLGRAQQQTFTGKIVGNGTPIEALVILVEEGTSVYATPAGAFSFTSRYQKPTIKIYHPGYAPFDTVLLTNGVTYELVPSEGAYYIRLINLFGRALSHMPIEEGADLRYTDEWGVERLYIEEERSHHSLRISNNAGFADYSYVAEISELAIRVPTLVLTEKPGLAPPDSLYIYLEEYLKIHRYSQDQNAIRQATRKLADFVKRAGHDIPISMLWQLAMSRCDSYKRVLLKRVIERKLDLMRKAASKGVEAIDRRFIGLAWECFQALREYMDADMELLKVHKNSILETVQSDIAKYQGFLDSLNGIAGKVSKDIEETLQLIRAKGLKQMEKIKTEISKH